MADTEDVKTSGGDPTSKNIDYSYDDDDDDDSGPPPYSDDELNGDDDELSNNKKKRFIFGCKKSELYNWEISNIDDKDTIYGINEYISELIRKDSMNIEQIISLPLSKDCTLEQFLLESMKIYLIDIGYLIVYMSEECNINSCPKMQATKKFRYRCSAHKGGPRDCCAIRYSIHILDHFSNLLTSKKYSNINNINKNILKQDLNNLCRRVYRIFAHAFYHHKLIFNKFESKYFLCTRFIMFFQKYRIVSNSHFANEIQIPNKFLYFKKDERANKSKKFIQQHKQVNQRVSQLIQLNNTFNKPNGNDLPQIKVPPEDIY